MQTEYEIRILDINVEEITKKLEEIGANHIIDREMRRCVYDLPMIEGIEDRWMRLRDNGKKVKLTIKEVESRTIEGTKEIEIEVSDFEKTRLLLSKMGFNERAYQENKRSSWSLDGVDIEIDSWPKIPTYLEVEGKSSEEVKLTVEKLGYNIDETTAIGVKEVFKHYGINIDDFKELKF